MRLILITGLLILRLFAVEPLFNYVYAEKLSFTQAINMMMHQNGDIISSALTIDQKGLEKKSAFGLHMPQVTVDLKYTHMNDKLSLDVEIPLPAVLGGPQKLDYKLQDQNFLKSNVSVMWPLFTGGQVMAANDAADADFKGAVADYDIMKNSMMADLVSKYFAMMLAIEASKVRNEVLSSLEHHYKNALAQENAGVSPRVERMHAEVSMNDAKREYERSLRDIEIAGSALKSLIFVDFEPEPSTYLFIIDPSQIETLDYFVKTAALKSPQIDKVNSYAILARAGVDSSRATYIPTIFAYGDYELYRAQLTMNDPKWYVGIGASWNIFEGFKGHNSYLASLKAKESVSYKKTQVQRQVRSGAEVYYKQMQKAYEQYKAAKDTLSFTEEYLRVRQKSFESGIGTSIDVVDAQTALSKNKLDMMSAAYDFDVALANLLSLCGDAGLFENYSQNINAETIQ